MDLKNINFALFNRFEIVLTITNKTIRCQDQYIENDEIEVDQCSLCARFKTSELQIVYVIIALNTNSLSTSS